MIPPLLSHAPFLFYFLCSLCFPFFKFFLSLRAFKEFLNFWKQTAGKGFYLMLRDIYIRLLFCHISPFLFGFQGTMPHRGGENFCLYLSPFLYRVPLLPFQFRQYIRRDTVNQPL